MNVMQLYDLKNFMTRNELFLSYSGPMSQNIIVEVSELLQERLKAEASNKKFSRKIFAIFIELLQNVLHYSAEEELNEHDNSRSPIGLTVVGKNSSNIFVMSGNIIDREQRYSLEKKLELVNSLSADKLKKLYKETLRQPADPNSKGAGLGIIDIARKSGNPLIYEFHEVNRDSFFFSLKAQIFHTHEAA